MPQTLLTVEQLYHQCPSQWLDFQSTSSLINNTQPFKQERALQAIEFAVGMPYEGYNLYVAGSVGLGKFTLVEQRLKDLAKQQDSALELCYIHNFDAAHKPKALVLPAGTAKGLQRDMEALLEYLLTAIAEIFTSEEYCARREELKLEFEEQEQQAFNKLNDHARELNVGIFRTPAGYTLGPLVDNQRLGSNEFAALSEEEQDRIKANIETINSELKETIGQAPKWHEELAKKVKVLDQEFVHRVVDQRIASLKQQYHELAEVVAFIEAVFRDIIENADDFRGIKQYEDIPLRKLIHAPEFKRFHINVLVDHSANGGVPVVYEDNPTYPNLLGRIEHESYMGALSTNFTLIKAGALHRANGGYLILDARKIVMSPFVWETLKRVLLSKEIRIQPLEQQLGLLSTTTLEPEPFPLNLKVVLIGDRYLYYLLKAYDPEMDQLFKVYSDFSEDIIRNQESVVAFAQLVAQLSQQENLKPLSRDAVARVIEQAARNTGDGEKLSLHVGRLMDLLREANYWCKHNGSKLIESEHVQKAVQQRIYREQQHQEKMLEAINRDILLIDVSGSQQGQINGLSVIELGDSLFGRPTRITATARLGSGKVIDIERETQLGGPIHSKGVMILSAYLAKHYAPDQPLSLSASLVFEQSYGAIEGDSASLAELCALLSAIAGVPIKQSLAVTGSVNQLGQVQAIGGVNEKIEGFFDVCQQHSGSLPEPVESGNGSQQGKQGVIIPAANIAHLMLRQDVITAATEKQFEVHAVKTVDEAITLLTDMEAGKANEQGHFPQGSFNALVQQRLQQLEQVRQRTKHNGGDKEPTEPDTGKGEVSDEPGQDRL